MATNRPATRCAAAAITAIKEIASAEFGGITSDEAKAAMLAASTAIMSHIGRHVWPDQFKSPEGRMAFVEQATRALIVAVEQITPDELR